MAKPPPARTAQRPSADRATVTPEINDDDLEATTGNAMVAADLQQMQEVDVSLAIALSDSEIERSIATAHRYPRSMAQAIRNCITLVTQDTPTAQECFYNLPRTDSDGKKVPILGPSIRLAELLAQQWGNNRYYSRVTVVDRREGFVEAEGVYQDLETNSTVGKKVRRRITTKYGKVFNADMIGVTANAAASIALRNAILAGIPKPIWRQAFEKALATFRGDEKTLGARRVVLLQSFQDLGVAEAQVYALAGVKGQQDVGLDELVALGGYYTALKSGDATLDELLGRPAQGTTTLKEAYDLKTGEVKDTKADTKAETKQGPEPEKTGASGTSSETRADTSGGTATGGATTATGGNGTGTTASGGGTTGPGNGTLFDNQTGPGGGMAGDALVEDRQEDRQAEPQEEEQGEPESQTDEAQDRQDDDAVIAPPDFAAMADWPAMRIALYEWPRTDEGREFVATYPGKMEELALAAINEKIADGYTEHRVDSDPWLFLLWLTMAERELPQEIKPTFRRLIREPAYQALNEDQKRALGERYQKAVGNVG